MLIYYTTKKNLSNNLNLRILTKNILLSKFPVLNQGIFYISFPKQKDKFIRKKSPTTRALSGENMLTYDNARK